MTEKSIDKEQLLNFAKIKCNTLNKACFGNTDHIQPIKIIKVASATVVVTLRLNINTNKIDHVLNVYIFYDEGYS